MNQLQVGIKEQNAQQCNKAAIRQIQLECIPTAPSTPDVKSAQQKAEELLLHINARRDWIEQEQSSIEAKIQEATRPLTMERRVKAEAHTALEREMQGLRYSHCVRL